MLWSMILATLFVVIVGPMGQRSSGSQAAQSAPQSSAQEQDQLFSFRAELVEHEGRTWNYRLLSPARVEPGKHYPLLFFLHGAGEPGDDNAAQLTHLPDGRRPFVADTGGHPRLRDEALHEVAATISGYALVDSRLSSEVVWRVATRCDGMCVNERGSIYATGKSVTIWSPDGQPLSTLEVPEQPANVCFGGQDGRTLFITARTSLYAVDLNVAGASNF